VNLKKQKYKTKQANKQKEKERKERKIEKQTIHFKFFCPHEKRAS
jgi:hypothetical protein